MENRLEVFDLSFLNVFQNLSFSLKKGSFTVLSGSNLCGKTTLIKLLAGIIPTSEKILLDRCYIESMKKEVRFKKLAVIFSLSPFSFLCEKVEEEVLYVLENLGYEEDEKMETLEQVLSTNSLLSYRKKSPHELSHFQQMKLLLALEMLSSPQVLLLDDPCAFLEKKEAKQFLLLLKQYQEKGTTIFMTTSKLEDALLADRLMILHAGMILLDGTPFTVMREDGLLNKIGLELPFLVDLSIKLQYYNLVDQIYLDEEALVDALWKLE